MLLDETFRVHPSGSRRWRFKAIVAMTIVGAICSLVTLQPTRSSAEPDKPLANVETKTEEKSDNQAEKS